MKCVNKTSNKISSEINGCLSIAHAISECETVSATYGLVKLREFKKLNESTWKDIHTVGNGNADLELCK